MEGEAPAFVTARPAAALVAWAQTEGCDTAALLGALEIAPAHLGNPDAHIPLHLYYELLERLERALGPDFGLRFCLSIDLSKWEKANVLQSASATVGEGLSRMLRYMRIWNSGERIWLERRGPVGALLYAPHGRPRLAHRIKAEMTFADFCMTGRNLGGTDEGLHRVRFRHRRPSSTAVQEQLFRAPLEFGAAVNEMIFDLELLELPIPTANPQALEFVERHLRAQLKQLPRCFVDRSKEVMVEELAHDHSLAGLARRMGLTPRTLQRQLSAEGTTHQRLLDDTRRELALRHLAGHMAIAEVAFVLGFSEASAFHRAFKRWTGMTPQAYQSIKSS